MGRAPNALLSTSIHSRLDFLDGVRRVYYATDDFSAGAHLMGERRDRAERLEGRRLEEADIVGAVSSQILDRWRVTHKPTFELPNGADTQRYADVDHAPLPVDADLSGPVAGVVGQFTPRINIELLEAVAARDLSLLLVGPRVGGWEPGRFEALTGRANVAWVGAKPLAELASYLRLLDVGLTPYVDSAFNRASFPLKTLEYLAAGRPVVSTPLPAVASLGTDLITTAVSPEAFADAAEASAASPRTRQDVERRQQFASRHSWTERARELTAVLGFDADLRSDGR
jgi:teichuronic acid biosynthesis glycosyltransferase TuaH